MFNSLQWIDNFSNCDVNIFDIALTISVPESSASNYQRVSWGGTAQFISS